MNEPVFMRGFAYKRGALADSTELQYTENEFILNKFLSCCDGCFYIQSGK